MKNRVQIWMSREDFEALLRALQSRGPVSDLSVEGGPLEALHIAAEEAHGNNANYDEDEGV